MVIQLVRRPGVDVDHRNPVASRAWIRRHVLEELRRIGQPHPKLYLLGDGFVETLDLDAMTRQDPDASLGMTFQLLRRRSNVQRCFLVVTGHGVDEEGEEHHLAIVFEELDVSDGRRWWVATLEYRTDPRTGLGQAVGEWEHLPQDTANPAELPAFLIEFAAPPPGGRPARVLDASDTWSPDMKFAFGELPPEAPLPTDARMMVELTAALGAVGELLSGEMKGTIVVRIAGREWEQWVLGSDLPASLTEIIRWIASHRLPPAEGVALAHIAIRSQDDPPVLGVQVIGQFGDQVVEAWAPIEDAEDGTRTVPVVHWWNARTVDDAHRWIGVPSTAELIETGPIG